MIKEFITNTNLKVVLDRHIGVGTCAIGIGSQFGSRDESKSNSGYTHFLEHMLFKSNYVRSTYEIASTIDRYGGVFNGYTDKEEFFLHLWLPSNQVELGLQLLMEMFFQPAFLDDEIIKEISVVTSELDSVQDDHEELAMENFYKLLWPENPMGNPVGGQSSNIQTVTRNSLFQFYNELLVTSPVSLIVTGDFNEKSIRKQLMGLEKYPLASCKPSRTLDSMKRLRRETDLGFHQKQIFLTYAIEGNVSWKQSIMGQICSNIVGETVSSRLFQSLREEQGLCYSIASSVADYNDIQLFEIGATTIDQEKTRDAIFVEMEKIKKSGISNFEWQLGKDHFCGNLLIGKGDYDSQVRRLFTHINQGWSPKSIPDMVKYIQKIKIDDLNAYVDQIFNDNWSMYIG